MKTLFIIPIRGLKISENLGRGDKIQEDLLITNDRSFFEDDLRRRGVDCKRSLEMETLLESDSFIYFRGEVDEQADQDDFNLKLAHALGFLNSLWFSKDNSILFDRIVLAIGQRSDFAMGSYSCMYCTTSCFESNDDEPLSRDDLRASRKKYMDLLKAGYSFDTTELNLSSEMPQMARAVSWLATAREQESHLVKILLYMTCFETIFTTFTEKIAENLAERICRFLGSSKRQQEVIQTIRKAYAIRSTIVHGKPLDATTYQESIKIVQALDGYLRLTFNELWKEPKLWERMN